MRLTTKTSYGVRALVALALMYEKQRPVSTKEISDKEGISKIYLEQIFNKLKRKGLIKSVRGPRGGYLLSRHPQYVSVYDVLEALEEELSLVRESDGASGEVWEEVTRRIKDTLMCFSFQDLADKNTGMIYETNLLGQ